MQLSEHFTKEDFEKSNTAKRLSIDNTIPADLLQDAILTAAFMEKIRVYLSAVADKEIPIIVSSAYRCSALNKAIGSASTSDHPRMLAVDFIAPSFGSPYAICKAIEAVLDDLSIGQLLQEGTWVHVSRNQQISRSNRALTLRGTGFIQGIQE